MFTCERNPGASIFSLLHRLSVRVQLVLLEGTRDERNVLKMNVSPPGSPASVRLRVEVSPPSWYITPFQTACQMSWTFFV